MNKTRRLGLGEGECVQEPVGPFSRMQRVKEQRAVQRAQEEGMGDLQRGTMKGCEDGKQLVKSEYRSQQSMPMLKGKVGFNC